MRTAIAFIALALTASACVDNSGNDDEGGGGDGSGSGSGDGDGDDGDGDDGDGDDGDGDGGSVTPLAGGWHYDEVTPISSNCPTIVNQAQGGDFAITNATSAGFRVVPNDGTAPFPCTLTGSAFSCPERASSTQDYRSNGVDAVISILATASGTFSSAIRATGRQTASVSCVGTQCATLGGNLLPCTFVVDFVIRAD